LFPFGSRLRLDFASSRPYILVVRDPAVAADIAQSVAEAAAAAATLRPSLGLQLAKNPLAAAASVATGAPGPEIVSLETEYAEQLDKLLFRVRPLPGAGPFAPPERLLAAVACYSAPPPSTAAAVKRFTDYETLLLTDRRIATISEAATEFPYVPAYSSGARPAFIPLLSRPREELRFLLATGLSADIAADEAGNVNPLMQAPARMLLSFFDGSTWTLHFESPAQRLVAFRLIKDHLPRTAVVKM
jgi:hypothetical protein